jgi:hypothetical protein
MPLHRFIDRVLRVLGYSHVLLGDWFGNSLVSVARAEIEASGGVAYAETGTPSGELEITRFRLRGSTLKLTVSDDGEVTLSGKREHVAELADRIARRLHASQRRA